MHQFHKTRDGIKNGYVAVVYTGMQRRDQQAPTKNIKDLNYLDRFNVTQNFNYECSSPENAQTWIAKAALSAPANTASNAEAVFADAALVC